MKYSVVLPRGDARDPDETRRALEEARSLWTRGERRQALDQLRRAVAASKTAGQDERARALERTLATLEREEEPPAASESAVSRPKVSVERPPRPSSLRLPKSKMPNAATTAERATVRAASRKTPAEGEASTPDLEDVELRVTVAPSNWNLGSEEALVGHRAVRVAVLTDHGPRGTLVIQILAPGEVAPKGTRIAVLVTLDAPPDP